jgi:hypothetical protein
VPVLCWVLGGGLKVALVEMKGQLLLGEKEEPGQSVTVVSWGHRGVVFSVENGRLVGAGLASCTYSAVCEQACV